MVYGNIVSMEMFGFVYWLFVIAHGLIVFW
jgi:hypothetical protein